MPNIGIVLKQEIARLARKETRGQIETLKKSSAHYRKEIAQLRRDVTELTRELARLRKSAAGASARAPAQAADESLPRVRVPNAKAVQTMRARLGLSVAELAALVGVSGQSVYNWERGSARPSGKPLAGFVALRGIGKREARARLAELAAAEESAKPAAKPRRARRKGAAKPGRAAQPKGE
jgi:DNA-binding transcriptional regulator YiaG